MVELAELVIVAVAFWVIAYRRAKVAGSRPVLWAVITPVIYIATLVISQVGMGLILLYMGYRHLEDWRMLTVVPLVIAVAGAWLVMIPLKAKLISNLPTTTPGHPMNVIPLSPSEDRLSECRLELKNLATRKREKARETKATDGRAPEPRRARTDGSGPNAAHDDDDSP